MRRLTLPEYSTRAYHPVPAGEARALSATGVVRVAADLSGHTTFTSNSSVGVLRTDTLEVRITPKVGIRRLLWLVGYADDPNGWRHDDLVSLADVDGLVPALAISFLDATSRALAQGVLQGYHEREDALPILRGRLREADQLRGRLALAVPLEVRYDDYDIDIPENQILLTAALRLLRLPDLPSSSRHALRRLTALLADVSPLRAGQKPPSTSPDRRSRHYQPALAIARLVLAGRSIEQPVGQTTATGFVFDLNRVFERWLTVALTAAFRGHGGTLTGQWPGHLDSDRRIRLRPDLVWHHHGHPAAVADAKYKRLHPTTYPHGDLYQILAYSNVLGLAHGHLIYAAGDDQATTTHTIRRSGHQIHTWTLDLTRPSQQLLEDVQTIATAMAQPPASLRAARWPVRASPHPDGDYLDSSKSLGDLVSGPRHGRTISE